MFSFHSECMLGDSHGFVCRGAEKHGKGYLQWVLSEFIEQVITDEELDVEIDPKYAPFPCILASNASMTWCELSLSHTHSLEKEVPIDD
jgi:hypothetical protein